MRGRRHLLLVAALGLLGCDREPRSFRYQLVFGKGSPIRDGGHLYLGDARLGEVERPRERPSTGARMAVVSFTLKESVLLSERKDELALRYPSPCGPSAPIRVRIADLVEHEGKLRAGTHPNIKFRAAVIGEVPDGVELWIDGHEGAPKVTVGEAVVDVDGDPPARLFGLDCAESHEVTVDGATVGRIAAEGVVEADGANQETLERERSVATGLHRASLRHAKGPVPAARLLLGRPGACYRARLVAYVPSQGETELGGDRRHFEGRRLYQLFHRPEFFLEEAPSTARAEEGAMGELVRVDCAGR